MSSRPLVSFFGGWLARGEGTPRRGSHDRRLRATFGNLSRFGVPDESFAQDFSQVTRGFGFGFGFAFAFACLGSPRFRFLRRRLGCRAGAGPPPVRVIGRRALRGSPCCKEGAAALRRRAFLGGSTALPSSGSSPKSPTAAAMAAVH